MGMEPFDYLTYKKNKLAEQMQTKKPYRYSIKKICIVTFVVFFMLVMLVVSSKSSKIDIEYQVSTNPQNDDYEMKDDEFKEEEEARDARPAFRFTIDKRLFLIQQEEKGPSESKIVRNEDQTHGEVISQEEFNNFKINSNEVIQKAKKEEVKAKKEEVKEQLENKPIEIKNKEVQNQQNTPINNITVGSNQVSIKPRLPISSPPAQTQPLSPTVHAPIVPKQMSALEIPLTPSKVLIGRYTTIEEARKTQAAISGLSPEISPFVKKFNNYYTVQVGSYQSFDTAKAVAGSLKSRGFDVWIFQ